MNRSILASVSMALIALAGAATNASAQEKTRAEVRQELIQAENNGLQFVTDASYPDVDPIYARQVARMKAQNDSGIGAGMSGASAAGHPVAAHAPVDGTSIADECVGPASFCDLYFGS